MNILNNITTYTLYLTNNCMLNCPYCYEKKRREKEGLYKMSWEDIQSILDFALKHCPLDKELDISLFGGEPLFYLKDQVFPIINYIKTNYQRPYRLTIMSNGFNLTKELLNELEGINWHIMISLDGPYHIIKNNINENTFNHIISNIEMIPSEIRKSRIGLKATLSDDTIEYINEIYDFLNSFDVNIIYMSPTHEIDNYRIKQAIENFPISKIIHTRDGQLLTNKYYLNNNIELFFKMDEISLRGNSYANLKQKPCGWIKNGVISLSSYLIEKNLYFYPQLIEGKLALSPIDSKDCDNCILKNSYCHPQIIDKKNHLFNTGCLWYKTLREEIDKSGISF